MGVSISDYHAMRARLEKSGKMASASADLRPLGIVTLPAAGVKIRQGDKPPNKLEASWRRHIEAQHPGVAFRAQAIRFRLANGAWYKPDLMAWLNGRVVCWETKGGKGMKGHARGMITVKFAAATWPEVLFILVWKDETGSWKHQEVLP